MTAMCAHLAQAEEITLAIGQAFDLAYKKFLESGGKDVETRKQIGNLQKRVRLYSRKAAHKVQDQVDMHPEYICTQTQGRFFNFGHCQVCELLSKMSLT